MKYNTSIQYYKGIPVKLILYSDKHFSKLRAKRFMLGMPENWKYKQNVWIPNRFLEPDGTIKKNANIDFVFWQAQKDHKFEHAHMFFPWIK